MTDVRDLNLVQAAGYTFISGGSAYNLTLDFYPDYVEVINYTKSATAGQVSRSTWMRGFPAGDAVGIQVIADNGSTGNLNSVLETTNGFTWAGTDAAFTDMHRTVSGATQASPVVITTSAVHGLTDGDRVFLTDVGGMVEISNNEYQVDVLTTTTFALQDFQGNSIDGTGYTAYTSGGTATMKYEATAVENVAESFILTLGSAVVGNDSDVMFVHAVKYPGSVVDLGDVG